MLRIGICDDDRFVCSELERYVEKYAQNNNISVDIDVFYSGADYLRYLEQNLPLHLLFLDIELGDLTGIEIGERLRKHLENEVTQIVFISSKESYAMRLFAVRPMNFLVKPIKLDQVNAIIREYLRLYDSLENFFRYQNGKCVELVLFSQIMFFQCKGKKIQIVQERPEIAVIEFYGKMQDVLDQLKNNSFCQIHKSYIVNCNYVKQFKKDEVVLVNGESLPISRANKKNVDEWLLSSR